MKLTNDYIDAETNAMHFELEDRGFKYLLVWKEKGFKMKHLEDGRCPCCNHENRYKQDCPRFNLLLWDDEYRKSLMAIIAANIKGQLND